MQSGSCFFLTLFFGGKEGCSHAYILRLRVVVLRARPKADALRARVRNGGVLKVEVTFGQVEAFRDVRSHKLNSAPQRLRLVRVFLPCSGAFSVGVPEFVKVQEKGAF